MVGQNIEKKKNMRREILQTQEKKKKNIGKNDKKK